MNPSWIDKHSVNCIKCGILFDEREGITPLDGEGTLCPNCITIEELDAYEERISGVII